MGGLFTIKACGEGFSEALNGKGKGINSTGNKGERGF